MSGSVNEIVEQAVTATGQTAAVRRRGAWVLSVEGVTALTGALQRRRVAGGPTAPVTFNWTNVRGADGAAVVITGPGNVQVFEPEGAEFRVDVTAITGSGTIIYGRPAGDTDWR